MEIRTDLEDVVSLFFLLVLIFLCLVSIETGYYKNKYSSWQIAPVLVLQVKSSSCWPTACWHNSYRFREVCLNWIIISSIVDSCSLISMYICCSHIQYKLFIFRTCQFFFTLVSFYLAWKRFTPHLKMLWMECHHEDQLLRWQFPLYWTKPYPHLVLETLHSRMSWYVSFIRKCLVTLLSNFNDFATFITIMAIKFVENVCLLVHIYRYLYYVQY